MKLVSSLINSVEHILLNFHLVHTVEKKKLMTLCDGKRNEEEDSYLRIRLAMVFIVFVQLSFISK